ncbi:MAG: hypothetical protein Q7K44_03945 [Candidatus Liptonbacteria bacterium]|nr:hypothetical protein [Candidatus Liptonbacteria bacterium]
MKRIFKNLFRHRIKPVCAGRYVLLFFCFAILAAPLLAAAQAVTPATETPGAITRALSNVGDALGIVGSALGKITGGIIGGVLGSTIAWIVYVLNYIIATIFGVFISIIAWFIGIVIQINTNIVSTPIVQNGFSITLAVANLGFVLAIIVIAIMTILRYETYALKQTLWKLVAAAILVNFSLVIAGAILNFADTLTLYFLDGFTRGCTTGTSALNPLTYNPFDCFASSIAGAFAPQRVFLSPSNIGGLFDQDKFKGAAGIGQEFSGVITPLLNIFFPTLFMIIAVIALSGLFIMLLIRYIYLGILLILMPIVWLLWIFPVTSGQWTKWWSKFIQWTMFAPVVMFFIYLSILSLGVNNNSNPEAFLAALRVQSGNDSALVRGLSDILGNVASTALGTMLQMAIMVSLLFAGLYMAQSMGIMFADTVLKGAKAVTSGFGNFVKRRGIIGAGWAINKTPIPKWTAALQRGVGAKPKGFLRNAAKYTGLEFAGQKLGEGVAALHVATREGTVDEAEKRLAGRKKRELIGMFPGATNPEKISIMKRAAKEGYVKDLDLKNYLKEDLFKAYHIEIPNYKDVSEGKGAMLNEEAIRALEVALTTGNDTNLDEAIKKIVVSTTKGKIGSNDNVGDMYGSYGKDEKGNYKTFGGLSVEETQKWLKSLTKNVVTTNFALISSMLPKMNSKERDNFEELFNGVITDLRRAGNNDDAGKYEGNYKKIISNITLGYTEAATPAPGTTPGGGAPGGAPGGGATMP